MHKEIIEKSKANFEKTVSYFKEALGKIRTGRASTAIVDNLMVDYYGAKSPLKQVASISVPEPRMIVISPWDKDNLVAIEKAIKESDLNFNPSNDGQIIRINIPALTEERRKEFVKLLNNEAEGARVSIRKCREDIWDEIQALTIGEDDKFQGKEKLQKVVDEYNSIIEEIRKKKEAEIMQV
ncbi:MAG TPA: ribosome recycling factor [Candidatus Moranbacteria bacterium]|nr:ribosome recycling factor [Candidatus Moranbacteria bacterium]HAT74445.1 ribosome recycling factor [Candidatus Moranbacteria bacterium]